MTRRGDTSPKKLTARERYLEKVQNNKIVAQIEQLYKAGYTADEIRAAGPNAYNELMAARPPKVPPIPSSPYYTVKDGDTIEGIAQQFNMNPAAFLNMNPEVKAPKTGMVVNVPPVAPNVVYKQVKDYTPPDLLFDVGGKAIESYLTGFYGPLGRFIWSGKW